MIQIGAASRGEHEVLNVSDESRRKLRNPRIEVREL